MTAGSGLVHSEMPSAEIREKGGTVEGFQLWVNLPRKDKMIAPRYQDTAAELIPKVPIPGASEGSTVKVVAGDACGASAVIDTRTPIVFLDVTLASPGDRFVHPLGADFAAVVYTFRSAALVGKDATRLVEGQAAEFKAEEGGIVIEAASDITEPVRCLLIGGVPLKEPVVQYGPFVMNTEEEIMEAIRDFQAGKMGSIEGESERMRETRESRAKQERTGRWKKDSEEL
jgi:redox-sensitive bicupin YhaK (pirin superfamily)